MQRVKALCVLNIHNDTQQLAYASEANRGVYIVNYATAEGWKGEIHLNNERNTIRGFYVPWPFLNV